MNAKTLTMALFSMVMFAATPWVLAATIPLPDHRPGNVSPELFNYVRHTMASIKQFDLGKLGIPVEKSLRLAGGASKTSHSMAFMLDAISPKKMEPMLAWYRKRLPGWKLSEHYAGRLGTLISPKYDGVKISIMSCTGGTYQNFPCGSHVRFYNIYGKQGSPAAKRVHILSGQNHSHEPPLPEHAEHNMESKRKANRQPRVSQNALQADESGARKSNVVEEDAKDIAHQSADEAHQSVKQGIQNGAFQ